ncbi:alkaline phosphatase [Myxococcus sp. AM009]|uniref:M91 family zinc metallopeptidase n=1 Tax=unclassified Myxococcus TaxID=2648731 RepID=UPI001595A567|nr:MULTISPECIES: M91 family zinc metallopeptidase [unclassified Myxococcus]NVI96791.1 alkaline phosphatase [Myxococcus sp. AM009]NVJ16291.1 alkaline phosphatase [Myxococcus sp. AM010]
MSSIGSAGSRPSSSSQSRTVEPKVAQKAPAEARPAPSGNAVKDAVAGRFRDGFDAAPRGAAPQRKPVLSEVGGFIESAGQRPEALASSTLPPTTRAAAPTVSTDAAGRTVVDLSSGNDTATVSQTADGGLQVRSGGNTVTLTAEQARTAIIRGGDGNDTITVDASVTQDVRIEGGAGDDTLVGGAGNDRLDGGAGSDIIRGGAGNDALRGADGDDYLDGGAGDDRMYGGAGRDVMYGLDGEDRMSGGAGRDYLDGGAGNDFVSGGDGDDQVLGGRGDDALVGGRGNDAVAGGLGQDTVRGGAGDDKLYVQDDDDVRNLEAGDTRQVVDMSGADTLGSSVSVTGSADFTARTQSDLDALRSLPEGQALLARLDGSGRSTTIRETNRGNTAGATNFNDGYMSADGTPGPGTDSQVNYNPSRISIGGEEWMNRPPVVGLFHELIHASDFVTGTLPPGSTDGVINVEQSTVGLPYDHDGDPSTPRIEADRSTENDLRDELNLPTRPRY